jgi:Papain family cysteine protease
MKKFILAFTFAAFAALAAPIDSQVVTPPAKQPDKTPVKVDDVPKKLPQGPVDAAYEADRKAGKYVADKSKGAGKYGRGYKLPTKEVSAARHAKSDAVHGEKLKRLYSAKAVPSSYDAVTVGQDDGIVGDQGGCGNCYMWSMFKTLLCGQFTAGLMKPGTVDASVQWGLDCHPEWGGCDGGDEWEVGQTLLTTGAPTVLQYPGLGQNPSRCGTFAGSPMTIATMFYCDVGAGANSVASTQSIQVALMQYGPIDIAVAAGSWGDPGTSIMVGNDNSIDHSIQITGWKMNPNGNGKVVWKCKNQWSKDWGDNGYCWIQEGSYSVGTEAFGVTVAGTPPGPPAPPTPVPPTPTPTTGTITVKISGQPDQVLPFNIPAATLPSNTEIAPMGTNAAMAVIRNAVNSLPAPQQGGKK